MTTDELARTWMMHGMIVQVPSNGETVFKRIAA